MTPHPLCTRNISCSRLSLQAPFRFLPPQTIFCLLSPPLTALLFPPAFQGFLPPAPRTHTVPPGSAAPESLPSPAATLPSVPYALLCLPQFHAPHKAEYDGGSDSFCIHPRCWYSLCATQFPSPPGMPLSLPA